MDNSAITNGKNDVKNAYNTGQNAINAFNPDATASNQLSQQQGLYGAGGTQTGQMTDYMKAYQNAIKANPTANDYYNQGMSAFNVQPLQQNANQLQNAVLTAPQTNVNNARGFNYDNNQLQAQTNQDLARLSPLAAAAQNQAQTAQQNALNYQAAGLQQNATNLQPIQAFGGQLTNQLNNQATGLNTLQTNQLNALVSKMQSGVQLSQSEMQQLSALAQAEESANAAVTTANIGKSQAENVAKIGAQNQILSPGSTYFNPTTGVAYNPFAAIARP